MQRNEILLLGTGACGGALIGDILKRDSRFNHLLINSNKSDYNYLIENKEYKISKSNIYTFPNAVGTAKDRNLTKQYMQKYIGQVIERINAIDSRIVFIATSFAGGSGSAISVMLADMLVKKTNKIVNIIGVLPAYHESKKSLKNAIDTWNDLMKININGSIFLLDNNKRENIFEINEEFAQLFIDVMNVRPKGRLTLDHREVEVLLTGKGSVGIYKLESVTPQGLKASIRYSIFATYQSKAVENIGVFLEQDSDSSLNEYEIIEGVVEDYEDLFVGYTNQNIVVLSGGQPQVEAIQCIKLQKDEKDSKKLKKQNYENLIIDVEEVDKEDNNAVDVDDDYVDIENKSDSLDDDIINDDDYWSKWCN